MKITGDILVIEDSATRIEWFREHLPAARFATTPVEAVAALNRSRPSCVFLDFDLGAANSVGIAQMLADDPPALCVIHSANESGAALLKQILPSAVVLPFASFQIVHNVIRKNA